MAPSIISDGNTAFRIKRPVTTAHGIVLDVDPAVTGHLDELGELLSRRIIRPRRWEEEADEDEEAKYGDAASSVIAEAPSATPTTKDVVPASAGSSVKRSGGDRRDRGEGDASGRRPRRRHGARSAMHDLLDRDLTPKRATGERRWAEDSLADALRSAGRDDEFLTLAEHIDATPDLSELKYTFDALLDQDRFMLDYNARVILDHHPIRNYLVAYAFHVMGLRELQGLRNFIVNNSRGVRSVADYSLVSAARDYVEREQRRVPTVSDDDGRFVKAVEAANLSMASGRFEAALESLVDDFVFNHDFAKLIDDADIGPVPSEIRPQLIQYIKNSPVPIDEDNVNYFLPMFISQIVGTLEIGELPEADLERSDQDFAVEFFSDDRSIIQVSRSTVRCAAQLYYTMVLGDELEVFNAVNYFTHKYLLREGFDIEDVHLRRDLQMYVFSEKFTVTDPRTHQRRIVDRTRPAERQMFYRQVFNYGSAPVTDDLIVNDDFPRLWKVLMLECAKYLERAQISPHPDSFVSKQNVMQAVEDLQYNLSLHCTGMATVMTPLIYEELEFVTRRILMHREVLRHVVPAGGTWWKVVEKLSLGMRNTRPRATVLNNKAQFGHNIIRSVADYDPVEFERDSAFSAFISSVEAFITTQSILQEALTDDLKQLADGSDGAELVGSPPLEQVQIPTAPSTTPPAGEDEWDF